MDNPEDIAKAKKFIEDTLQKSSPARILIIGKTGVGKSTFINSLFGEKVAEAGIGESVTSKVTTYELKVSNSVAVQLIDTPGLWDSQGRDEEHLQLIRQEIQQPLDAIFLLASVTSPRCDQTDQEMLKKYASLLPHTNFWSKLFLILTRAGGGVNDSLEIARTNYKECKRTWRNRILEIASFKPTTGTEKRFPPAQGVDRPAKGLLLLHGKSWLKKLLKKLSFIELSKYVKLLNIMDSDFPRALSASLLIRHSQTIQVNSLQRLSRGEALRTAGSRQAFRERTETVRQARGKTLRNVCNTTVSEARFLELVDDRLRELRIEGAPKVKALYTFVPPSRTQDFLPFNRGDIVAVYNNEDRTGSMEWGYGEKRDGSKGYFPLNYVIRTF